MPIRERASTPPSQPPRPPRGRRPPAAHGFVAPLGFVLGRVHVGGGDAAQHDVARVLQPGARGCERGVLRGPHALARASGTGCEGVRSVARAAKALRTRTDGRVFVIPERVDLGAVVFGRDVPHARAPPRALHGLAFDAHRRRLPLGLGVGHAAAHLGRELQDAETRHVLAVPRDMCQSLLLVLRQIIRGGGHGAHRHRARFRGCWRSRRARAFLARSGAADARGGVPTIVAVLQLFSDELAPTTRKCRRCRSRHRSDKRRRKTRAARRY